MCRRAARGFGAQESKEDMHIRDRTSVVTVTLRDWIHIRQLREVGRQIDRHMPSHIWIRFLTVTHTHTHTHTTWMVQICKERKLE